MKTYHLTPVPKPRQTRRDIWSQRPCVMRYRRFADEVRRLRIHIPESGAWVKFYLPMPESWSKKRRDAMNGRPHQAKKDIDNILKALLDSVYAEDKNVWDIRVSKFWSEAGMIVIE